MLRFSVVFTSWGSNHPDDKPNHNWDPTRYCLYRKWTEKEHCMPSLAATIMRDLFTPVLAKRNARQGYCKTHAYFRYFTCIYTYKQKTVSDKIKHTNSTSKHPSGFDDKYSYLTCSSFDIRLCSKRFHFCFYKMAELD